MKKDYFGDSYDLVKRFFAQTCEKVVAPLYAEEYYIPSELRVSYTALTSIDMFGCKSNSSQRFGLILDPNTGIPLPDAKAQNLTRDYAPLSYIERKFNELNPTYMICFDQCHDRHRGPSYRLPEQHEAKRKFLLSKMIYSFYYTSHAPFIFMAKKIDHLKAVRAKIIEAGIPEWENGFKRLQQIRTE